MQARINWICELPTHYNDFLFNRLTSDGRVKLKVYYVFAQLQSHPWKTFERKYEFEILKRHLGVDWGLVFRSLFRRKEIFIVGGWYSWTMILVILTRMVVRGRYVIWTDTPKVNSRRGLAARLRTSWIKFVLNGAFSIWGTGTMAVRNLLALHAPAARTHNLPYFTDTQVFKPDEIAASQGEFIFISSGRLKNEHKGFDLAVKALGMLHSNYPNIRFRYYVAGAGPDQENLVDSCRQTGIVSFVIFLGWLDLKDLEMFYKKGNFFLHPARYEPFGVAVIEAMASGLIVIGSDATGAIEDRIRDGENGFIHESGNVAMLYEKLVRLVHLPPVAIELMRKRSIEVSNQWSLGKGTNLIYQYLCVE